MKPKSENTAAGGGKGFDRYNGVQRLSLPAGQVLIYRGNKAPGVFIFLSGCVRSGARVWRSDGTHQPFLIPDASGLDSPFPENVTIEMMRPPYFSPGRSSFARSRCNSS